MTKIVKRGEKGNLIVVSGDASDNAIRAFFSKASVTNYRLKETSKVSQCSVINNMIKAEKKISEIATKLISMKLFPANPEKYEGQEETRIVKACVQRVNTHLAASRARGIDLRA